MESNQHITKATKTIAVSVINATFAGGTTTLAESAILLDYDTPQERIVGIEYHGRGEGRTPRTNRAIACQIARSIRAREARKEA